MHRLYNVISQDLGHALSAEVTGVPAPAGCTRKVSIKIFVANEACLPRSRPPTVNYHAWAVHRSRKMHQKSFNADKKARMVKYCRGLTDASFSAKVPRMRKRWVSC